MELQLQFRDVATVIYVFLINEMFHTSFAHVALCVFVMSQSYSSQKKRRRNPTLVFSVDMRLLQPKVYNVTVVSL